MSHNKTTQDLPILLQQLLATRSPSGYEFEGQQVLDTFLKPKMNVYTQDVMGNRMATLNTHAGPKLILASHIDELGFMIKYIDEQGFIYFDTIGGHDVLLLPGRMVEILTSTGTVQGVIGKTAIHLIEVDKRTTAPKLHELWIDIGATDKTEALKQVSIGDPIVYRAQPAMLGPTIFTSRGLDNKIGCYIVCEVLERLSHLKATLNVEVTGIFSTQEEIGTRGAIVGSYAVNPDIAINIDVGHATDYPSGTPKQHGLSSLGKGPLINKGPNTNPKLLQLILECAKHHQLPYQLRSEPKPASNDARAFQVSRSGIATGVLAIPLRYMHTPHEIVDMQDVEITIELLVAVIQSLTNSNDFTF